MIIYLSIASLFSCLGCWRVWYVKMLEKREREFYEMLEKTIAKARQEVANIVPDSRDLIKPGEDDTDLSWQPIDEKSRVKS